MHPTLRLVTRNTHLACVLFQVLFRNHNSCALVLVLLLVVQIALVMMVDMPMDHQTFFHLVALEKFAEALVVEMLDMPLVLRHLN